MQFPSRNTFYLYAVTAAGIAAVLHSAVNLPFEKVNFYFLALFAFTIGFGSRMSIRIPRTKSHISVSDTFIFLAILLFGGELAIILAAIEAFFSARRFCNKTLTVFANAATMAVATFLVVWVLRIAGLYSEPQLQGHEGHLQDFTTALLLIAVTQFIANTGVAVLYDFFSSGQALTETWKSKYAWSFASYLVGAVGAGILVQLSFGIGPWAMVAAFPVTYLMFLTYRMYLANVEMSVEQAKQAEEYARTLEKQSLELRDSERRFRSAFNYAPIGIALVSPAGRWLKTNRALSEILGYRPEEFLSSDFQSMIFREDVASTFSLIHDLIDGKIASAQMEQRYVHKDGHAVWVSWSGSIASDNNSTNPTLIFQVHDITDKKRVEQKLRHEATHDALTGLPNRAYFMHRLSEALDKFRDDPKYQVSVLFIDLDRFKYVNDSLGHLAGDQLLISIAERLSECLRAPDMIARLGGDEFVILVEGRYYNETVTRIAERVQRKFATAFQIGGHEIYSSASIGILHASERHNTPEEMMRDADIAMYQAKRSGKARHEVFEETMHSAARETLQLETEMRRAIEKEEFEVYYQPIFSVEDGSIIGAESLSRWHHPEYGDVPPTKFIPLAEEIGLIDQLGELVLRKSCREIIQIEDLFENVPDFHLSVNLSCRQFEQPRLVANITELLASTGFPPHALRIEITESVVFEHQERAIEMLHELRRLGIEIALDDFGTGYSNLGYLVRLPISVLKVDRSFVSSIGLHGERSEMVRAVVTMAHGLGLTVVAEGVETESQFGVLRQVGCEAAQGFLLARPMNITDLKKFIAGVGDIRIPAAIMDELLVPLVQ